MIWQYFKLKEQPFGVTPDPRYLYASASHREALASLLYGLQSGCGFVALIAKPGMGKTTLLFELLSKLRDTRTTVFLFQTITTPLDLLRAILIDLGVKDVRESLVDLQTQLNSVLLTQRAARKPVVVVIDEAQNLNDSVLETVRMLSNFETASQKLMQIILVGQLQLAEIIGSPQLLQLRQRISIFAHLTPLSITETATYIQHRLKFAGLETNESLFTPTALLLIARHSEGIPRNINNLCFNALSLAYALKRPKVDSEIVNEVISDLNVREHLLSADQSQFESTDSLPLEVSIPDDRANFNFDRLEPISNDHMESSIHQAELSPLEDRKPLLNESPILAIETPQVASAFDRQPSPENTPHQTVQNVTEKEFQAKTDIAIPATENAFSLTPDIEEYMISARRAEHAISDRASHSDDLSMVAVADSKRTSSLSLDTSSSKNESSDEILFEDFNTRSSWVSDQRSWNLAGITAIVALAGLCIWLGTVDHRLVFSDGAIYASTKSDAPAPVVANNPEPEPRRSIRVKRAESLATFCSNLYGECTPELLEQLLAENPSILYPNRLRPGQIISIPLDSHTAKTEK